MGVPFSLRQLGQIRGAAKKEIAKLPTRQVSDALKAAVKLRLAECVLEKKSVDDTVAALMALSETQSFIDYFKNKIPNETARLMVEADLTRKLLSEYKKMAIRGRY
jgi:hypothetical protein